MRTRFPGVQGLGARVWGSVLGDVNKYVGQSQPTQEVRELMARRDRKNIDRDIHSS